MELRSKTAENERQSSSVPPKYFIMSIVIYTVYYLCFNLCFVIFVFCSFVSFGRLLKKNNYFASSDPHHDISKQLVDTTFV
jgi:hypothetical protein